MGNLFSGMEDARVMDIKIGFRTTVDENSNDDIVEAQIGGMSTTTSLYGFRITGLKIKDG